MKFPESIIAMLFGFEFYLNSYLMQGSNIQGSTIHVLWRTWYRTAVAPRMTFSRVCPYGHATQCSKRLQTCIVLCKTGALVRQYHANPDLTLKGEVQISVEGPCTSWSCFNPYFGNVCRKWPLWGLFTTVASSHSCEARTKCHVWLIYRRTLLITADNARLPQLNVHISAHFQSKVLKYFPPQRQPVGLLGYSLASSPRCGWGPLLTVWHPILAKTLPPQQLNYNNTLILPPFFFSFLRPDTIF